MMFGIDLGMNIASVIYIAGRKVAYVKVFNFKSYKDIPESKRFSTIAADLNRAVVTAGMVGDVCIEEPIYSWGRKNPKGFAKSCMLFALLRFFLEENGFKVHPVNNKSAKKMAGHGSKDKLAMIKAFEKRTGKRYNGPQYAKETVADSYFIAEYGRMMHGVGTKKDPTRKG